MSFHDQKLWQESYVALMDIYEVGEQNEVHDLLESAQEVGEPHPSG